jgi:hypothetical protein
LEFLEKLYKKEDPVRMPIERDEDDYYNSDDSEEKIEADETSQTLIDTYISPLKQIDEWNNFKSLINRLKTN